jgi:hypothetical protein
MTYGDEFRCMRAIWSPRAHALRVERERAVENLSNICMQTKNHIAVAKLRAHARSVGPLIASATHLCTRKNRQSERRGRS